MILIVIANKQIINKSKLFIFLIKNLKYIILMYTMKCFNSKFVPIGIK